MLPGADGGGTMSVWDKLVDWFLGPDEDDEAEAPKVERPRRDRAALPDLPDDVDEDRLTPEVDRVLAARYGAAPADSWEPPRLDDPGGLVGRVLRYDRGAPGAAHRVWVSRGLRAWRKPHEIVVRARGAGDDPVPDWPRALILALDARTREGDRTLPLGEIVRDLDVPGAPSRQFLLVPDPELEWIEDPFSPDDGLAFVQAVPLDEARLAALDDPTTRAAALAAWSQADHLLLV